MSEKAYRIGSFAFWGTAKQPQNRAETQESVQMRWQTYIHKLTCSVEFTTNEHFHIYGFH